MGLKENINNSDDSKAAQSSDDFKTAQKWAVFGVIGNIALTIIKGLAGIIGGSSAMVADALHSASDIFASAVVFVGLKISAKPADKNHPYGHGKAEAIATFIVGGMLLFAGLQILRAGIGAIRSGSIEAPGIIALYAAIFSLVTKETMYRFTYRVGKRINSPATIANAMDHRSDAVSSIATFIGIGGATLGFTIMDPIAAILVSFFIIKMGVDVLRNGISQIMDSSAETEKIDAIEKIALNTPGVKEAHDIRIRQSGSLYLVDLHISVDKYMPLYQAHEIGDVVTDSIHKDMAKISEVIVHVDPDEED